MTLARIRAALAAAPEPVAEPVAPPEPEPPRRVHLYGSTYSVKMSFAEVMAARGYAPEDLYMRRKLANEGSPLAQITGRNDIDVQLDGGII
jgi:hypothetical protein